MLQRLRDTADSVSRWMSSDRLKLNPSKTELIWFYSGRRQLSSVEDDIVFFGNRITLVHTVRDFVHQFWHAETLSCCLIATCHCLSMSELLFPTSVDPSIEEGHVCWIKTSLGACIAWFIVGWTTVIVFLHVCLGLLPSSYSPCWILLFVWFWLEAIWSHYTRSDGVCFFQSLCWQFDIIMQFIQTYRHAYIDILLILFSNGFQDEWSLMYVRYADRIFGFQIIINIGYKLIITYDEEKTRVLIK